MERFGFPEPVLVVWAITLTEIIAGLLLALGYGVRHASLALASVAAGGIALIHHRFGWFVGEHGTGGSEYSVCLLLCLLVLAAADGEHAFADGNGRCPTTRLSGASRRRA